MIDEDTFNEEINNCRQNYSKGFCGWGKCENCGAVPLLVKLHRGEFVEDKAEVDIIKKDLLCD